MTQTLTNMLAILVAATLLIYGVAVTPVSAEDHGAEEDHEEEMMDDEHEDEHAHDDEEVEHSETHTISVSADMDDATRIEKMETLLQLLMQLVELLEHQMEHTSVAQVEVLKVTVEEHGGTTHIHVYENGKQTDAFFLEELTTDQEAEIITAVAERIDYSVAEVEAAITFPAHAMDDMHDDHEDEEMDLDGIHIMGDGSVMLGNGEVVADATVTDDGMIMLADGTLVEPVLDMREGGDMEDVEDHDDHM